MNDEIIEDLVGITETNKRICNLERKMELILNKLDKLDKLDKLEKLEKLENIEENCSKMGNHINFVEAVYETLRAPLQFISNKLSSTPAAFPSTHDNDNITYNINNN